MAKSRVVDAVSKVVSVLESLKAGERARVVRAVLTLVSDESGKALAEVVDAGGAGGQVLPGKGVQAGEKAYFDSKEPRTKLEELAVAARFREEKEGATASTRADIEKVVKAARRNFDASNFRRDLDNARRKGLFNSGTGKDSIVLSYFGQEYVDALPNRKEVKAKRKPKRSARVRKKGG